MGLFAAIAAVFMFNKRRTNTFRLVRLICCSLLRACIIGANSANFSNRKNKLKNLSGKQQIVDAQIFLHKFRV